MNRRDFLKLLSILPPAYLLPKIKLHGDQMDRKIVILIFDAWSAKNMSLYGYPRRTTPNLEKLSNKAIVYHNHYAAGHYTYPSTASLLTGVLPWTHRGQWSNSQELLDTFNSQNLFTIFDSVHRFAYTHNKLADEILIKMVNAIDSYYPPATLSLSKTPWFDNLFLTDPDTSSVAWTRALDILDDGYAHTLFLSRINGFIREIARRNYTEAYPRGIPEMHRNLNFLFKPTIDWALKQIKDIGSPSISYLHFLPPHDPYNTRIEFFNHFLNDGYSPPKKPVHTLSKEGLTYEKQQQSRQEYDEYILFVDAEIGRIMETLEQDGELENTWVIISSDHGEMFERGIPAHDRPTLHQPLIHIPLVIFPPGQKERIDIHSLTSTIDILPTLLHLFKKPQLDWLEGEILPPYGSGFPQNRTLYSVDGRYNQTTGPFKNGAVAMFKGDNKLIYIFGNGGKYAPLQGNPVFELYNLREDPEELTNLYKPDNPLFNQLFEEMQDQMRKAGIL